MADVKRGSKRVDAANAVAAEELSEVNEVRELLEAELPPSAAILILRDNAQGNLRSLINVNAVNSLIQVLVNLNININSTVGSVQQINLSKEV